MTNKYNFDDITNADRPVIVMGGKQYVLRYPTLEEVEALQKLENDDQRGDVMYSYIEPTEEGQPPFKELLRKQDIRVVKAFSQMLRKEFGVED